MEKDALDILLDMEERLGGSSVRRWIHKDEIDDEFGNMKAGNMSIGAAAKKVGKFKEELESFVKEGKVLEVYEMGTPIGYCLPWHDDQRGKKMLNKKQGPGYQVTASSE